MEVKFLYVKMRLNEGKNWIKNWNIWGNYPQMVNSNKVIRGFENEG